MGFFDTIFGGDPPNKDTAGNVLGWNELTELKQLDEIESESQDLAVVIFKHSTRCRISRMSLKAFERDYAIPAEQAKLYFLDLLRHRDISDGISKKFGVYHESPQLLLVRNGAAVYHESHSSISAEELKKRIGN